MLKKIGKKFSSPYTKWVALAFLAVGLLDINLIHLTLPSWVHLPLLHIGVAGLLMLYGGGILLFVRWPKPVPKGETAPAKLKTELTPRSYPATVTIVALRFLFRAVFLVAAVGYFAHALANIEPSMFSAYAKTTWPYVTMQYRHTVQMIAEILEYLFPDQIIVLINRQHPYSLLFKGGLWLVHSFLIFGTGYIIFKLGKNKGYLEEVGEALRAGSAKLSHTKAAPTSGDQG